MWGIMEKVEIETESEILQSEMKNQAYSPSKDKPVKAKVEKSSLEVVSIFSSYESLV